MTTAPQESQKQPPPPPPVDTVKDIAGLYSRLQAAVNDKSVNDEAKFIPLPPSLPMSPSSSSPTPLRISRASRTPSTPRSSSSSDGNKPTAASEVCACQHILVGRDSLDCSLCGRTIPIMEQLQREKKMHEQEIKDLEVRLEEEQGKITQQLEEIETLQATLAEVEDQLQVKEQEFAALQKDMEILNEKYVDEIERVAEIQHSKDMVENELEDLSRRLFEEANGMVANEKREKHNLEVAQRHLEMQLRETQDRLAAEQMQLRELRQKMQEMAQEQESRLSATPTAASSFEDNDDTQSVTTASDSVDHRGARDMSFLLSDRSSLQISALPVADTVDQMLLAEFEEFVKMSASVPLKKLHTLPFMKHCQVEDVEPCLRFGANPRLSARKVSEAIVLNTCFIEETPPGFLEEQAQRPPDVPLKISASKNLLWERISNGGNPINITSACQACGRQDQESLPYRFRTSYFDDWACIDRYCRDRLVAVCEFYVFIRNVRQGYYSSRSIPDLYHEVMRLRLQMFYARMGALPWRLRSLGLKGEEVGKASPPQVRIPPPSNSESSPLPRSGSHQKEKAQRHASAQELSVKPSTSVSSQSTNTTSSALFILSGPI